MGRRAFWAVLVASTALLIAAWQYGAIPSYAQYCQTDEATHQKNCAAYHITLVALFHLGKALNDYGDAVIALGTLAIAAFTFVLYRATNRLYEAGERQIKLSRSVAAVQARNTRRQL